jgi:hypothetical protein
MFCKSSDFATENLFFVLARQVRWIAIKKDSPFKKN